MLFHFTQTMIVVVLQIEIFGLTRISSTGFSTLAAKPILSYHIMLQSILDKNHISCRTNRSFQRVGLSKLAVTYVVVYQHLLSFRMSQLATTYELNTLWTNSSELWRLSFLQLVSAVTLLVIWPTAWQLVISILLFRNGHDTKKLSACLTGNINDSLVTKYSAYWRWLQQRRNSVWQTITSWWMEYRLRPSRVG